MGATISTTLWNSRTTVTKWVIGVRSTWYPKNEIIIFWRFVFWRCLIAQVFQFLLMYPKRTVYIEHYISPFTVRTLNLGWLWLKLGLTLAESSFGFLLMYPNQTVYIEHYISLFTVRLGYICKIAEKNRWNLTALRVRVRVELRQVRVDIKAG